MEPQIPLAALGPETKQNLQCVYVKCTYSSQCCCPDSSLPQSALTTSTGRIGMTTLRIYNSSI